MFSVDADLFFRSPRNELPPPNWFGVLYLLRRDIDQCMGIHPTTGQPLGSSVEWPGAITMLAGIDLLAKFFAGSDDQGKVTERFRNFLVQYFTGLSQSDRDVIYQLRNALLHSFGLYSKGGGKVYRFFLTGHGSGPLVSHTPPEQYNVDLRVLHREFEGAVAGYQAALQSDTQLQANFSAMFGNYGRIYIG
jgi:hypothetical protein